MCKNSIKLILFVIVLLVSSCSQGPSKFTHFVMRSHQFGVLLESSDQKELNQLHEYFYDRKVENTAGPDFLYIIDIKTENEKTRWQYSEDGYMMAFGTSDKTIFKIVNVDKFNRLVKVR